MKPTKLNAKHLAMTFIWLRFILERNNHLFNQLFMTTSGLVALECHRHRDFHGQISQNSIFMRGLMVIHSKPRAGKDAFKCLSVKRPLVGWTKAVQAVLELFARMCKQTVLVQWALKMEVSKILKCMDRHISIVIIMVEQLDSTQDSFILDSYRGLYSRGTT